MNIKVTKKQKTGIAIFLIIILIITSIIYFKNKAQVPEDELKKNSVLVRNDNKASSLPEEKDIKKNSQSSIKAYICGYIVKPGVYTLNQGDRIDDLVKLSGGFTKEADPLGVNLAYEVKDQDYIRILSKDETKDKEVSNMKNTSIIKEGNANSSEANTEKEGESTESEKININNAPKEKLKELPRIGDALSQRIIDYREKEGGFKVLEDIKEVSGIGDKMFENIKDKISVE